MQEEKGNPIEMQPIEVKQTIKKLKKNRNLRFSLTSSTSSELLSSDEVVSTCASDACSI
jgi:hypothetical protein